MQVVVSHIGKFFISYDMTNYLLDHGAELKWINDIKHQLILIETMNNGNFYFRSIRTDPMIIEAIKNTDDHNNDIEEVPDEATDFLVAERNGYETLYYILNGKLHIV